MMAAATNFESDTKISQMAMIVLGPDVKLMKKNDIALHIVVK